MLTILLFVACSKMMGKRINTRSCTKEKPYTIICICFFANLVRQKEKSQKDELNTCIYVRYVPKVFLCLSLVTKNCETQVKSNPPFQMSTILKFVFQKWKQLRFSEENYLHFTLKTQFCMWQLRVFLKQGQTGVSSGPITLPLITLVRQQIIIRARFKELSWT